VNQQARQPSRYRAELARASALMSEGRYGEAEAVVREILTRAPRDTSAIHMLGLIRNDAGDAADGERLLRQSIELEPSHADFHSNLANLLRRQGRHADAERGFREALQLNPQHRGARYGLARALNALGQFGAAEVECRALIAAQPGEPRGWTALALTLRDQNRLAEAESAYRQAISADPRFVPAHHNLAALLAQMERAEEALAALESASALGVPGFEAAATRGRVLTQLYRMEEAERAYQDAIARNPIHVDTQLQLARVRHLRGDPEFARDLAAAAATNPDNVPLQLALATVLRQAGNLDGAHTVLRDLISRGSPTPDARAALAQVLHEAGLMNDAENEAMEAATAKPQDGAVVETLVAILLSRGRPEDAQPFVAAQRDKSPIDQGWIAYEATVARLLERPLYRQLCDYTRLVRTYDVEPPPGWRSMDELTAALLEALNARHAFANQPLEHDVRNGTQTARNLVTDPDSAIQALFKACDGPVQSYRQEIGLDSAHPLSARNRGASALSNAWSVRLNRGGLLLNHFHRHGWISAAYYVSVPEETQDLTLMAGWLKFGEPRFATPGATPEVFIKPQVGRLVLFPSYLWHGTNPLQGTEPRTSISFNIVPVTR
jgi:Flp pilus assembly protein TadD